MDFLLELLPAVMLAFAVSIDAFLASVSYGTDNIKVPPSSMGVIAGISAFAMWISLYLGEVISQFVSENLATLISFYALLLIGAVKLFDSFIKSELKKKAIKKHINFKLLSLGFVLEIYADTKQADKDNSKSLSPTEAAAFAFAISFDAIAAGLGAGVGQMKITAAVVLLGLFTILAMVSGIALGQQLDKVFKKDFSYLGGVALIIFAFIHLNL